MKIWRRILTNAGRVAIITGGITIVLGGVYTNINFTIAGFVQIMGGISTLAFVE